jgi:methylmalonyl-CoA/ethylmalonyl-CoA epimerase
MTFHHLGIATESLEADATAYSALGYRPEGEKFIDEVQGVRGLFLSGGGPRLELLEPLPGRETLGPILRRGVKCYHHGYEVRSLSESLAELRRCGAQMVRPAAKAIAFDYRQVVFLMLPNMWMVELIESS